MKNNYLSIRYGDIEKELTKLYHPQKYGNYCTFKEGWDTRIKYVKE